MFQNYFKPTPAGLLRVSLGLKTMIGTLSGAAYFNGNKDAAFWFLVAGAVVDFIINCFGDDKNKAATVIIVAVATAFLFSSCNVVKHHKSNVVSTFDSSTTVATSSCDVKKDNAITHSATFTDKQKTLSFTFAADPAKQKKPIIIKDSNNTTIIDLGGNIATSFDYVAHDAGNAVKDSAGAKKDSAFASSNKTETKSTINSTTENDKSSSRFNWWWIMGIGIVALVLFVAFSLAKMAA
jgi:hypothetical protein